MGDGWAGKSSVIFRWAGRVETRRKQTGKSNNKKEKHIEEYYDGNSGGGARRGEGRREGEGGRTEMKCRMGMESLGVIVTSSSSARNSTLAAVHMASKDILNLVEKGEEQENEGQSGREDSDAPPHC